MLTVNLLYKLKLLPRDYVVNPEAEVEISNFLSFLYLFYGQEIPSNISIISSLSLLITNIKSKAAIKFVIDITRFYLDDMFYDKNINFDNYHDFWEEQIENRKSKVTKLIKDYIYLSDYHACSHYISPKHLCDYLRKLHLARTEDNKLILGLLSYYQLIWLSNYLNEFDDNRRERKEIKFYV